MKSQFFFSCKHCTDLQNLLFCKETWCKDGESIRSAIGLLLPPPSLSSQKTHKTLLSGLIYCELLLTFSGPIEAQSILH